MSNFVGFQAALGDTVSVPAHANGDILVLMAMNATASTIPSTPAGWTNIVGSSATKGCRLAWVQSDGSIASVTAANATGLAVWVFTNPDTTAIGGFSSWSTWTGRTGLSIPSVSLADADGSSTRVAGVMVEATGLTFTPEAGLQNRQQVSGSGYTYAFFDQANVTTAGTNNAAIAPSGTYNSRGISCEVRLVPVVGSGGKLRPYMMG